MYFNAAFGTPMMKIGIVVAMTKPSFHMMAHDRRIAENTASDRLSDYMETFFSDRAIVSNPTFEFLWFSTEGVPSSTPAVYYLDKL